MTYPDDYDLWQTETGDLYRYPRGCCEMATGKIIARAPLAPVYWALPRWPVDVPGAMVGRPMERPDPPCDPAFWMALEARLGRIEAVLAGGLSPEVEQRLQDLKVRLSVARLRLDAAIHRQTHPTPRKEKPT